MHTVFALIAWMNISAPAPEKPGLQFKGARAYCYFRKHELLWKIGNDVSERTIRFDRTTGALRTEGKSARVPAPAAVSVAGVEGEFTIFHESGGSRSVLRLDADWQYLWHTISHPGHGGRLLTVHLQGRGANQGFEAEASYEVYPGNRPFFVKWLTLINRTGGTVLLEGVSIDRWALEPPKMKREKDAPVPPAPQVFAEDNAGAVIDGASHSGLLVWMPDGGEIGSANGALAARQKRAVSLHGQGGRADTPKAVVAAFRGSLDMAGALQQHYALEAAAAALPKVAR